MSERDTSRLAPFEPWSPVAFLAAGGLFVCFAVLWGAAAVTELAPRPAVDVFGPAGWVAAFVGLLGLYPAVGDRSPKLARAGALLAVIGLVGGTVTAVANLGQLVGAIPEPPAWFAALNLLLVLGIVPGFLAFAVAVLRTGADSRTVGILLLAPAVLFVVNIVRVALLGPRAPTGAPFVLGGGQALVLLAIGYALRTSRQPTDRTERATDSVP
jgi:hypothetical protein